MSEVKIRNIDPRELQAIKEKKSAKNIKEEEIGQEIETVELTEEKVKLKTKLSKFEPQPVKYKLPTLNKIIRKNLTANHEIYIRRMTTVEESMMAKIKSMKELFDIMTQILENCIKSDIKTKHISTVDKFSIFLFLLSITYGEKHKVGITCETCGEPTDTEIDLANLPTNYLESDYKYPYPIKIDSYGGDVTAYFNFSTIEDEQLFYDEKPFEVQIRSLLNKIEGTFEDGESVSNDPDTIVEFSNNLSSDDRAKIRDFISDMAKYGVNRNMEDYRCMNKKCEDYNLSKVTEIPITDILLSVMMNRKS